LIFKGFLPGAHRQERPLRLGRHHDRHDGRRHHYDQRPERHAAGKGQPINGIYGFSLAWDFQSGPLATRNPDPTIFNEPIIG